MMPRNAKKPARRKARQDRSRETVRILFEAAAQVLREGGYAGATTNHIAERAGVSIGTLYQYFADKDELFDALAKRYFAEVVDAVQAQPLNTALPLEANLRMLISAGITAQRHGPDLLRALEQVPNAVLRRRLTAGKRQLVAFLCELLEAYRDLVRPIDLERAAMLLMNAAEGIGYNEGPHGYDDRLTDELTTLFMRYLVDT
jgi:AcrR family transcriptional regulator